MALHVSVSYLIIRKSVVTEIMTESKSANLVPPKKGSNRVHRLLLIDAVRGLAILGVVLFHFVWDLEFVGFISGIAFHPIWLAFGRILAGTFMFLVGVSLVLAHRQELKAKAFAKRLLILLLAASMITLVTWYAFPDTFIYFGILHAIVVASVVGLIFLKVPTPVTFLAGVLIFILPLFISSPVFDTRWLAWIGFSEFPPRSNDFVPVFPWVGLSLIGLAVTKFLHQKAEFVIFFNRFDGRPLIKRTGWLGRHSLIIYLLHQPALLAVILPIAQLME